MSVGRVDVDYQTAQIITAGEYEGEIAALRRQLEEEEGVLQLIAQIDGILDTASVPRTGKRHHKSREHLGPAERVGLLVERVSDLEAALRECGGSPNHSDDTFALRFCCAMREKLAEKRDQGMGGWDDPARCQPRKLARFLMEHLTKGDMVDIANFAMMLHFRLGGGQALAALAGRPADDVH